MKKGTLTAILIGAVCLCGMACFFPKTFKLPLKPHLRLIQDKVMEKCNGDNEIIIDMSDFTDFEWDQCIVYRAGTWTKDIRETFHVNYKTSLDLQSGIVFFQDGEAVYEEFFKDIEYLSTDKVPPFLILPYGEEEEKKGGSSIKYAGFERKEAKFKCIKEHRESKGLFGKKGYYSYGLYPIR